MSEQEHRAPWSLERHMGVAPYPHAEPPPRETDTPQPPDALRFSRAGEQPTERTEGRAGPI